MRLIFLLFLFSSFQGYAQWKTYIIGVKGDTLNRIDNKGLKQGKWINHVDELRGEPGYEEEGEYKNNRKEGLWRIYSLEGDLSGLENYKWGNKDGNCQYFNAAGALVREEGWLAMNPYKQYDTLQVEDIDHLDHYKTVIVKNEGVAIRNGKWNFYDPATGIIYKTDIYTVGKLEPSKVNPRSLVANDSTKTPIKPKEVLEYERKNAGKKENKSPRRLS